MAEIGTMMTEVWQAFFDWYLIVGIAIGAAAIVPLALNPWRSHQIMMRNWPKPPPFPHENKRG